MEEIKTTELARVIEIISNLRQKCPWDREQTIDSLKMMTVEECYELVDAINNKDYANLKEELGDILLHIIFYSKIGEEQGLFSLEEVAKALGDKLIYRHPHVYGDLSVKKATEVERNWEQLKKIEKKGTRDGILSVVAASLPAVMKACKLQKRAAKNGFDWEHRDAVWEKVEEELAETREAIAAEIPDSVEAEFGDLLFSVINAARLHGVDPEQALERTNRKFMARFACMEQQTAANGKVWKDLSTQEMEQFWDVAKQRERSKNE